MTLDILQLKQKQKLQEHGCFTPVILVNVSLNKPKFSLLVNMI